MSDVCKWGGSSLATGKRALNVANFIKANSLPIVVLSAPGKITALDEKITDLFIKISQNSPISDQIFEKIKFKYADIIKTLKVDFDIDKHLQKIKASYAKTQDKSYLISRGEYLMAKIFSKHLGYKFVDSKDIIKFDKDGKLLNTSFALIKQTLSKYKKVVIPGFYGSYKNNIKIFSRGGSDITGAIISKALNLNYTNYTDIDGVYNSYPLTNNSKKLKNISYRDMKFLGLFGFSVLHHKCCDILEGTNLKINVKSTFEPEKRPTTIQTTPCLVSARSKSCGYIIQTDGDVLDALKDAKIFVLFRYIYLNSYFYLVSNNEIDKLKNYHVYPVNIEAIISKRQIKNAFYLGKNKYLKITKKE